MSNVFLSLLHRNSNGFHAGGNVAALQRNCGRRKEQFTVFAQRSRLVTCQRWLTLHARECFIPATQSIVCHVYVINHAGIGPLFGAIVAGGHKTRAFPGLFVFGSSGFKLFAVN